MSVFETSFITTLLLTFRLAITTAIILLVVGLPLSYWLAFTKKKLALLIEVMVAMPLILPPTVLGFYFLIFFNPYSFLGKTLRDIFGEDLVFSFAGIVFGSVVYSLPFMVQPITNALKTVPNSMIEMSAILGKNKWQTLRFVMIPYIKKNIVSAFVITFAHTIGEFGVVLMIGGSLPGKTKVASIAIYENVDSLQYELAHQQALILLVICFSILLGVFLFNGTHMKNNSMLS